ncbi:hypothetical protein NDA18_005660 [Ustilago nuda]|nr:hypothetical protein NDA18_005660 [Ustilago nuda]
MVGATIELFSTSILSNVKVRTRHERFTSVLAIKKIPYIYHDLASDDDAKSRWRRKAKDPQLPGILVNNEWVGSYDEFQEAVEFGELEVLLGVSPAAAQATPPAPHPAQSAVSSKDPSLYPTLPYAAEGAGSWKEPDADEFILSLNIKEEELNDDDVDALLADIGKPPAEAATRSEKKYVPSKEAAIKPLRLAKMGATTSHQRMPSGWPSPTAASAATRASPVALYSAMQRSTRALAAEAAALTSNRKTSGALLRDAVSQGKTLDDAMEESRMKQMVSQDNIDELFASLGLSNVDIGEDEVDQFLEQGAIPQGLGLGGERVHRPTSVADKARDEAVARDLALKAKEKGHGSSLAHESTSKLTALAGPAPASPIGTSVEDASAKRWTASRGTLTLSAQPSTVTEAALRRPKWKRDEATEAVEREKEVVKLEAEAPKQSLAAAAEEGEEEAEATKDVGDEPAKKADDEDPSSEAAEIKAKVERHILEEALPLSTNAEMSKTDVVDTQETEEEKATPGASTSNRKDDVAPQHSESTPKEAEEAEAALATLLSAKDQVSGDEKRAASEPNKDLRSVTLSSDANEPVSSRSSEWEQSARSGAYDSTRASKEHSLSSSSTSNQMLDKADIDRDPRPTKEISADPIQLEGESIAKAETKRQEADKAKNGEASELQLAQKAAMTASQYQNRKSGVPLQFQSIVTVEEKDEEAPLESWTIITSRSNSNSSNGNGNSLLSKDPEVTSAAKSPSCSAAAITSPVHIPVCQESKEGSCSSTSPLPLGLGARGQPPSRQASSGSVSSSRRAIDVSRPIDPSISPTSPLAPPSSSELFMSPETLAKKKRVGLFGLGKDKDKERDKTTANDKNSKAAAVSGAASGAAPSTSRHERTISQILREADAVLQMGGQGSDNDQEDETEDPTMFGSSSVDI